MKSYENDSNPPRPKNGSKYTNTYMGMGVGIPMASKNISITEDVYNKLIRAKRENESFSELFLRLLSIQRTAMEKSFGTWNLNENESSEIWGDITKRPGRKWKKSPLGSN